MHTQDQQPTARTVNIQLPDVTALAVRLAHILAEEVDCLDEMRVRDIEKFQDEKRRLIRALMLMKKEVERDPDIRKNFSRDDIQTFANVSEIFDEVLQENHRKLLVAKEINLRIVQAIADVVKEEAANNSYNRRGRSGAPARDAAPSVSLNETI